ncbi:MAG: hypothetical protein J1D85_07350 [Bacteroidales bacterium]|nr:hypothetical protein [Bacteroidales bacterium]
MDDKDNKQRLCIREPKRQRFTLGSIVEIPVKGEFFCYGQLVYDHGIVVFEYRSTETPEDLTIFQTLPILFRVGYWGDYIGSGRWMKIGKLPIREDCKTLKNRFISLSWMKGDWYKYFPDRYPNHKREDEPGRLDSLSSVIWIIDYSIPGGRQRIATKEEAACLEREKGWNDEDIEDRICAFYYGTRCHALMDEYELFPDVDPVTKRRRENYVAPSAPEEAGAGQTTEPAAKEEAYVLQDHKEALKEFSKRWESIGNQKISIREPKRQQVTEGAVVEIPVFSRFFCYGQIIPHGHIAIFEYSTTETPEDLTIFQTLPILFKVSIDGDYVKCGKWMKIGKLPIREDCRAAPKKFVNHKWRKGEWCKYFPQITPPVPYDEFFPGSFYEEFYIIDPESGTRAMRRGTKEEAEGLERDEVWSGGRIEQRLFDHYLGLRCLGLSDEYELFPDIDPITKRKKGNRIIPLSLPMLVGEDKPVGYVEDKG